jgi:hypothetical protein
MILSLIQKTISHFIGEGFLWKTLGFVFLTISSATAFYFKIVHDIEIQHQQNKELLLSMQEVLLHSEQILQNKINHLEQLELDRVNKEFYINLSYIGTFFLVVGGVVLIHNFFPHMLEYIWPTNTSNINIIKTINEMSIETSKQLTLNQTSMINYLSGKFDIMLNNQMSINQNLNQILSNQNTTANFALGALRRTEDFGFRPKP